MKPMAFAYGQHKLGYLTYRNRGKMSRYDNVKMKL